MRQSQLFTKTIKDLPKDEASYNAQTLIRAGFIDKVGAGIYNYLPLGKRVLDKICQIIREEIDAIGGQELLMTALVPKESWETTGRWETFDALFRLAGNDQKEYALGATHEEVVTPLAGKYIMSYKDLPFSVYQIQTKFRNEKRAKAGLLRGREFLMKDLYSFHANQEDLDEFYTKAIGAYKRIYDRLSLGATTYLTYASGGSFAKYSHEFQALAEAGEDWIYICDACKVAVNKEIVGEQDSCPLCGNKDLREEKAIEVGNIFKLGTRFSEPFGLKYKDAEGHDNPVVMGCYGIGPSRILGTIVEACHDSKGMIWPEAVAPYRVHLLSLGENGEAEKVYQDLRSAGWDVLYDDRDLSAGEKFADADLIGCPYRLVVSRKTLEASEVEMKRRGDDASVRLSLSNLSQNLKIYVQ